MPLIRFPLAADFLSAAQDFLTWREVENCLPLGIAAQLIERPDRITTPPYLAGVEQHGRVVAAAIMTLPGRLIVAHTDALDALQPVAADFLAFGTPLARVTGSTPVSAAFVEHWQVLTGITAEPGMSERLYQLTRVNHPSGVPGHARRATAADRDLLIEWLEAFEREAFGVVSDDPASWVDNILTIHSRGICLWEDQDEVVSLAGFGGRTPNGIRIGPVYTPPARRGRGYASACVARLSQDHLDAGRRFCCLYTDLANPTSNHIYQAIGYEPVCDVQEYRLQPTAA